MEIQRQVLVNPLVVTDILPEAHLLIIAAEPLLFMVEAVIVEARTALVEVEVLIAQGVAVVEATAAVEVAEDAKKIF